MTTISSSRNQITASATSTVETAKKKAITIESSESRLCNTFTLMPKHCNVTCPAKSIFYKIDKIRIDIQITNTKYVIA